MDLLERFEQECWDAVVSPHEQRRALESLEGGRVLYFPHLDFPFQSAERALLSRQWACALTKTSVTPPTSAC